ncbi:hypothetical protein [Rhodopseudomonas palustris]|uniref:hypothetical protein n=1 Tax=Rhodopseudomonas palustris TaxID=1076 RepID=UPI0012EE6546
MLQARLAASVHAKASGVRESGSGSERPANRRDSQGSLANFALRAYLDDIAAEL